jgi:hypothetical protein
MKNVLQLPIRIHKAIALRHAAAGLWYVCRALDTKGTGRVNLFAQDWQLLKVSKSTIYRWLRQGHALGLFRNYWWEGDRLSISLGALSKACLKSGMKSWGAAAVVSLGDIIGNLRSLASAISVHDLQEKSRFAAKTALNGLERKFFKIPTATETLNLTSQNMASGVVPGLIHVGADKVFVGRSFIPFGVSQERVCEDLNAEETSCGVSPRTLRNHLKRQGVERRQLVQAKPEYRAIGSAIAFGAAGDLINLDETNGKTSAKRPGGHLLKPERFFRYFRADWLYRCNLYALAHELSSMKYSRRKYKKLQPKPGAIAMLPVENSTLQISPQTPIRAKSLEALAAGGALGNQIKAAKNDNSYEEQLSADNEERARLEAREKCMNLVRKLAAKIKQERWQKLHGNLELKTIS